MPLILLSNGMAAQVDEDDVADLSTFRWHAHFMPKNGTWYADRTWEAGGKKYHESMHRRLKGNPRGLQVDHENGDTLDNRKQNLRVATKAQNMWNRPAPANNTSGVKGVLFCKQTGRWRAELQANGKKKWLGRFDTKELAAAAVEAARSLLHGEFACGTRRST